MIQKTYDIDQIEEKSKILSTQFQKIVPKKANISFAMSVIFTFLYWELLNTMVVIASHNEKGILDFLSQTRDKLNAIVDDLEEKHFKKEKRINH